MICKPDTYWLLKKFFFQWLVHLNYENNVINLNYYFNTITRLIFSLLENSDFEFPCMHIISLE